jgi:integrase
MGCIYKRGKKYWIKYYRYGKQYAESSQSDKKAVAERLLKLREGEIAQGKMPSVCFDRIIFDELMEDFLTDYQINCKRSLNRAEGCTRKLLKEFAGTKVPDITTARIKHYVAKRQLEGVSNATINRELSAIKRAFNLAYKSTPPKVAQVPYIPMLVENNVRKGFIEYAEYKRLLNELPDYLKPVFTFAYLTGWRKSEILDLKWSHVNLTDGIVRLEPGETKNKEGRTLYIEPELWDMVKQLHMHRRMDCLYVFSLNGKRIGSFRKTWKKACAKIGRPDLLFHDLRRSGVRNMVRAGIPERVVMTISGHKTRSVFDRYDIVSERDMQEAAQKRHEFSERQTERLQFSYNQHQKAQRVTTSVP